MKPRQQRMLALGLSAIGLIAASFLTFKAFNENMMFFVNITDAVEKNNIPINKDFRVGGLVIEGSISRQPGNLMMSFALTDNMNRLEVEYTGVVPDLFREGQGVIAHGRLKENGVFVAKTILAKHDENYMPPEVMESLATHVAEKVSSNSDQ
ncbi:MAG: cytochrome c-type biogenesis protein CcmE [Woeseiaceae bacterium]|jgi:cytochrome c-type biogenesis protein CcmE|tara:strand:+ start:2383 stop:2838 length:456 start_codon:yes stop_codon:yes gene_type:complete